MKKASNIVEEVKSEWENESKAGYKVITSLIDNHIEMQYIQSPFWGVLDVVKLEIQEELIRRKMRLYFASLENLKELISKFESHIKRITTEKEKISNKKAIKMLDDNNELLKKDFMVKRIIFEELKNFFIDNNTKEIDEDILKVYCKTWGLNCYAKRVSIND